MGKKLIALIATLLLFIICFIWSKTAPIDDYFGEEEYSIQFGYSFGGDDSCDAVIEEKDYDGVVHVIINTENSMNLIKEIALNELNEDFSVGKKIGSIKNVKPNQIVELRMKLDSKNPKRIIVIKLNGNIVERFVPIYNQRALIYEVEPYKELQKEIGDNIKEMGCRISSKDITYQLTPYPNGIETIERFTLDDLSNQTQMVEFLCDRQLKSIQIRELNKDNSYLIDEIVDIPANIPIGINVNWKSGNKLLIIETQKGKIFYSIIKYDEKFNYFEFSNEYLEENNK